MSKIKISKATIENASKIGDIAYQVAQIHYQKTKKEFKKSKRENQIEYIRKSILDKNILVLQALIDDNVVGYVVVYFNTYPKEYFQFNKRAFIGSIGVDQNYQRKGVGKALLKAVENNVKKHQISIIEIDYYAFNKAAEALYIHCGYKTKKIYVSKFI